MTTLLRQSFVLRVRASAPALQRFGKPKMAGLLEYGGTYGGAYLLRRGLFMPWELSAFLDEDLVKQGWQDLQTLPALARSTGLNYWESLGYAFAGSALWEIAGENSLPSRNDQINTGIGGSFLGEVLFRLANLTLEHDNLPPLWRETAAELAAEAAELVAPGDIVMVKGSNGSKASLVAKALAALGGAA